MGYQLRIVKMDVVVIVVINVFSYSNPDFPVVLIFSSFSLVLVQLFCGRRRRHVFVSLLLLLKRNQLVEQQQNVCCCSFSLAKFCSSRWALKARIALMRRSSISSLKKLERFGESHRRTIHSGQEKLIHKNLLKRLEL